MHTALYSNHKICNSGLKPVNRNAPKPGSAPAQPAGARFAQKSAVSAPSHPPVFVSEGKKWRVVSKVLTLNDKHM